MYRYIGNKTKLLPHIIEQTQNLIGEHGTVVDLMAGTGSVALEYRKQGYRVIASDVMTYSVHHLNSNLLLSKAPAFKSLMESGVVEQAVDGYSAVLDYLNALPAKKSFFYNEFSPEGTPSSGLEPRKYFTSDNAGRIDAIREQINEWIQNGQISSLEESLLKHTLILAVNDVANISGTYGYFLSTFKKNAMTSLLLKPVTFFPDNPDGHLVMHGYAEELASSITADLCYIDPPYMKRQYAANYHILETIARGDFPDAIGKSGLRDWWDQHSKLCTKTRGLQSFETIISEMKCPKFLISYSEDGLFSIDQLRECFSKFGTVDVLELDYNRFKSNGSSLPQRITEYLIAVERQ
ncbi:DNA adenine methylase [Sellimonas intestinalis]|uniref:DNA adenine methylase n=1 Tax=Sellimonas intestinalis TaxID=1653434 RepID=UPI003AB76894